MSISPADHFFPEAIPASVDTYLARFRAFPFWYRWYLRLRTVIGSPTIATVTREHYLQEQRRHLRAVGGSYIDTAIPALLPPFHRRVHALQVELSRVKNSLAEATGSARGAFLCAVVERHLPELAATLNRAARLTEHERENPLLTVGEAQDAVAARVRAVLEGAFPDLERVVAPRWTALRALNVCQRLDLSPLQPVSTGKHTVTPLRTVASTLTALHQAVELCHHYYYPAATADAWEFATRRIRSQPGPPRSIWSHIEEFRTIVPLAELVCYAHGDPFLTVPTLTIKSDWWSPLLRVRVQRAREFVEAQLVESRRRYLNTTITTTFQGSENGVATVPGQLFTHTIGSIVALSRTDLFLDTRRAVAQLVIDGTFANYEAQQTLHAEIQRLDDSVDHVFVLFGSQTSRGKLADELQRLHHIGATSTVARQQRSALFERYRPHVREQIERFIDALGKIGAIVERGLHHPSIFFLPTGPNSVIIDRPIGELLQVVATYYQPLTHNLRGLYQLESRASRATTRLFHAGV